MARVQLVLGDMFDGPCDLIVLPCSTGGSVTTFVRERLHAFDLPSPPSGMTLGDVAIQPLDQRLQHVATYVAFAASVKGYTSSLAAIEHIGRELGAFTAKTTSCSRVSAPLLGAGAGGLREEDVAESLSNGFEQTAPEHALLNIYILKQDTYDSLLKGFTENAAAPAQPPVTRSRTPHLETLTARVDSILEVLDEGAPSEDFPHIRVFVSYTATNDAHRTWVKNLAAFLRTNGVDARLDQWHLRPGNDVAQWMCNEVDLADRVLMICNEEYARKADGRHGGVGWEIRLIQGYLLVEGASNPDKFIPIVCTRDFQDGLPKFLQTAYFIHWPTGDDSDDGRHNELLKILYKVQEEAPPIGRPPSSIINELRKRSPGRVSTAPGL